MNGEYVGQAEVIVGAVIAGLIWAVSLGAVGGIWGLALGELFLPGALVGIVAGSAQGAFLGYIATQRRDRAIRRKQAFVLAKVLSGLSIVLVGLALVVWLVRLAVG